MKIAVVFGGKSVEHEISIISAFQVIDVLKNKYEVLPVYISKSNNFYYSKKVNCLEDFKNRGYKKREKIKFIKKNGDSYIKGKRKEEFDLILPIVHGRGVEDGTLLSYFRFSGFDVMGDNISFYSAMQDKKLTKMLLDSLNIKNVSYQCFKRDDRLDKLKLEFPLIVKPNNLGSSIGIRVSNNFYEFEKSVEKTLKIDNEVLVESYLDKCREFNVSVLSNNGRIEASEVEEVIKEGVYTFNDKYLSNNKKKGMNITSKSNFEIEDDIKEGCKKIASIIYKEFKASGVIRVDFLYKDNELYVNEVNSIPGSYAYYLWKDKYDFLELLDITIKESKRYLYFLNKSNEVVNKDIIFTELNKY